MNSGIEGVRYRKFLHQDSCDYQKILVKYQQANTLGFSLGAFLRSKIRRECVCGSNVVLKNIDTVYFNKKRTILLLLKRIYSIL